LGVNIDSKGLVRMVSPSKYEGDVSYANQKIDDEPKVKNVNQLV